MTRGTTRTGPGGQATSPAAGERQAWQVSHGLCTSGRARRASHDPTEGRVAVGFEGHVEEVARRVRRAGHVSGWCEMTWPPRDLASFGRLVCRVAAAWQVYQRSQRGDRMRHILARRWRVVVRD